MIRLLTALFLGLTLAVTSVSAAVARSEMAGAVQMVICAGGTEGMVTLDPSGKPVTGHHCPDCTAASVALAGPLVQGAERPVTRAEAQVVPMRLSVVATAGMVPAARGPPPVM